MAEDAATGFVEDQVPKRLVGVDPPRLGPDRVAGGRFDASDDHVADLAFRMATDDLDRAAEIETMGVRHPRDIATPGRSGRVYAARMTTVSPVLVVSIDGVAPRHVTRTTMPTLTTLAREGASWCRGTDQAFRCLRESGEGARFHSG